MSDTGGIRAGKAYVEIYADNSMLIRGMRQSAQILKSFGSSFSSMGLKMMGVGTALVLPLLKAAQSAGNMGHELLAMSARTGASVESLSALGYAARQTGVSLEATEKGFKFMHKNLLAARQGSKDTATDFAQLGLTLEDLKNKSPEDTFILLSDRIGGLKDPTERAGMALKLFGRSGTELLPLFSLGAGGMSKLTAEAKRLGLIMSTEDARSAAVFYEELKRLVDVLKMGMFRVGSALIPVLRGVAEWVSNVAIKLTAWIKQNKQLVIDFLYFGSAILFGGIALFALGKAFTYVGSVISGVLSTFRLISSAVAMMISPFGLLAAAIGTLGYVFFNFTSYGGKALSWLGGRFGDLQNDTTETLSAISNALAKGDLGTAARIAWLFVKMEFLKAKNYLLEIWLGFKSKFLEYWNGIGYAMTTAWETAVYGISVGWAELVATLKTIWTTFKQWYGDTVDWMAEKILDVWLKWKEMTDKGFDVKAAKAEFQKTFSNDKNARANSAAQDIVAADQQRQKSESEAKAAYDNALLAAAQAYANDIMAVDAESQARLKAAQDELASAQAQWEAAKAEGNRPGIPSAPTPPAMPGALNDMLKSSVIGTFNPAAISQLGAATTVEKIAKNTWQSYQELVAIRRRLDRLPGGSENNWAP